MICGVKIFFRIFECTNIVLMLYNDVVTFSLNLSMFVLCNMSVLAQCTDTVLMLSNDVVTFSLKLSMFVLWNLCVLTQCSCYPMMQCMPMLMDLCAFRPQKSCKMLLLTMN